MSTVGGALSEVVQIVETTVDTILNTVESVLGSLPLVVTSPVGHSASGLSGVLDSAPGGLSASSIHGVTTLAHAGSGISNVENVAGGHALPFHDNTSVSVAFPVKH